MSGFTLQRFTSVLGTLRLSMQCGSVRPTHAAGPVRRLYGRGPRMGRDGQHIDVTVAEPPEHRERLVDFASPDEGPGTSAEAQVMLAVHPLSCLVSRDRRGAITRR